MESAVNVNGRLAQWKKVFICVNEVIAQSKYTIFPFLRPTQNTCVYDAEFVKPLI